MIRILLVLLLAGPAVVLAGGCKPPFPAQSKVGIQEDHTENYGGAMHKRDAEHPFRESSGCSDAACHKADLRGGLADVDGRAAIAPSCYQCHNQRWDGPRDDDPRDDSAAPGLTASLIPVHSTRILR